MMSPKTRHVHTWKICFLALFAGLWSCAAPPPPPPPRPPPAPPAPLPTSPDWVPSLVPSDLLVDDGYTLYTVTTHPSEDGGTSSWSLNARFRLYTAAPDRSLLKMRLHWGRDPVGDVMCPFRPNTDDGPAYIVADRCGGGDLRFEGSGELKIEWHFLNGVTDVPTRLRTHRIKIVEANRVDRNLDPAASEYIVDRHPEVLSTILWPRHPGGSPYVDPVEPELAPTEPRVELVLNLSPTGSEVPVETQFRCLVNGLGIQLGGYQIEPGPVTVSPGHLSEATYRRGPRRGETEPYEETLAFRQLILRLPLGHGAETANLQTLQGHPGSWVCTWEDQAQEPLRIFRWVVHEDGELSPHAEQFDTLTLAPGAYLVHTEIPPHSPIDARTSPAVVRSGAFHGRGLPTSEGTAAAREVPRIGRDYLPRK